MDLLVYWNIVIYHVQIKDLAQRQQNFVRLHYNEKVTFRDSVFFFQEYGLQKFYIDPLRPGLSKTITKIIEKNDKTLEWDTYEIILPKH